MLGSSSDKRVLAIKLNHNSHNFIIFNVYFPCLSVFIEYFYQIALISGFIDNIVRDHYDSDCDIIISGDFNCNAESFINNDALLMLLDLFNSYDLNFLMTITLALLTTLLNASVITHLLGLIIYLYLSPYWII